MENKQENRNGKFYEVENSLNQEFSQLVHFWCNQEFLFNSQLVILQSFVTKLNEHNFIDVYHAPNIIDDSVKKRLLCHPDGGRGGGVKTNFKYYRLRYKVELLPLREFS